MSIGMKSIAAGIMMMGSLPNIRHHSFQVVLLLLALTVLNSPSSYGVINSDPTTALDRSRTAPNVIDTPVSQNNGRPSSASIGPSSNQWEGSGANPDDEDGDADEDGSGDGPPGEEGSGAPPEEVNVRKGETTTTKTDAGRKPGEQQPDSDRRLPPAVIGGDQGGRGIVPQYDNTTIRPSFPPAGIITTSSPAIPMITTTRPMLLTTTLRAPGMRPTTAITTTPTTAATSKRPTKAPPEAKWPPAATTRRPFFMADPTGTLDQLRPGIFAFMVGGAVVALLLLILIISYLVYRLKKRDEGTYICEEPHQQAHYSYAYQKASIREFYA